MANQGQKLVRPADEGTPNRGPLIAGLLLIFVGIYFFLERLAILPPFRASWPALLVIVGIALVVTYISTYSGRSQ
ncbi:MAG: DUF5668 domain-containing protein [Candidatus Andersenbacteria bacterium]